MVYLCFIRRSLFSPLSYFPPNSQRIPRGSSLLFSFLYNLLRSLSIFLFISISTFSLFFLNKMQSSLSLTFSPTTSAAATISRSHHSLPLSTAKPLNLRFCGLRREALGLGFSTSLNRNLRRQHSAIVSAARSDNGSSTSGSFDYDLLIIGAGVGGHGAALHAVEKV